MKSIETLFTEHPRDVGMNYFQHFLYALTVAWRLFFCTFACLIHAFFPFLFTNTTSNVVSTLNDEFTSHQNEYD